MTILRNAFVIMSKDLRIEAKSKQVLPTMLVFAGLVILVFSFAFNATQATTKIVIPGLIWVITVFSGILGLNRSFVSEQKNDNLHAMMIAPIHSISLYLGKFFANFALILIVQLFAIPFLLLLFDFSFQAPIGWFLLTVLAGTFGFSSVGTFVAAIAGNSSSSEMLLPLLLFPITTPILIGVVKVTETLLVHPDKVSGSLGWLQLVAGYDIIFFGICVILFDYILEV